MPRRRRIPASIRLPRIWRRRPLLAIVLLAVAALVTYERGFDRQPRSDDYTRYHNQTFEVARVVDGDTLDVNVPDADRPTTRIRLWGVDTPEVAGSPGGEMYYGAEASAFAKRQLTGRRIRLVLSPKRTRGKYGRLLAYAHLEPSGEMFNELLITHGFAYADGRFTHPLRRQFQEVERRARRNGVGLWAEITIDQMPEWRQRLERD